MKAHKIKRIRIDDYVGLLPLNGDWNKVNLAFWYRMMMSRSTFYCLLPLWMYTLLLCPSCSQFAIRSPHALHCFTTRIVSDIIRACTYACTYMERKVLGRS